MKGTEFLIEAKKIHQDSIRVLLTGYAGLESAITAINDHLLDKYLTKPIKDEHDFILNIQHLLQRFQMKKTIEDQNKFIHDLYTFANVLNAIEDFQKTLDYIVSFTGEALLCNRISIMLIEDNLLRIRAAKGLPEDVIYSTHIPIGDRISGEVLLSRKAVIAKSLEEVPYIDGTVGSTAQSFMSAPILYVGLTSSEYPLGVINVTNKVDDKPFTEADMETLTYIANTASIAIHNHLNRIRLQSAYSETRTKAATLEYQMTHDTLTDLPNRTMLHDRLMQTILAGQRKDKSFALLLMDLNEFKEINDTLGHHNGDMLLQQIRPRLQSVLQKSDTLARMGGDEFAVLLPDMGIKDATSIAGKMIEALEQPFVLEGLSLQVSGSIGIACCPNHGEDPNLLIQRAEVAMYMAKNAGDGYKIFDPEHDPYNPRRLTIISELRHAIDDDQLILYYQPKIDFKTKHISGMEALVRWQHPRYDFMPPDQFIPLAEQTGLIKPLTMWVFNEALRQCRDRCDAGIELGVAVNVSARNLQDIQLPDQISRLLKTWGISPHLLELEITESTIMSNLETSMDVLTRLSGMGIRLSVDDFGTGHSSLAYLKKLPINEIKIDKSFIKGIGTDDNDTLIVQATIDLGHNLGLTVVAEGVENEEIYHRLANLGCDVGQGYFISHPISDAELKRWLCESPWGLKGVSK
ncbi:MAG: EAL domain-containing protein [Nitrospirae bacterium]|nr:EAL domain-containing protein [Nitrospirota bacterium]